MREWLVAATEYAILVIDTVAFFVIVIGTIDVIVRVLRAAFSGALRQEKREVWLRYARFLVAALTFQLAADIIETSVSTSWEAIARLGAIAVIRTFLEYFLDRDIGEVRERRQQGSGRPDAAREHAAHSGTERS
jgi:uncharacterized membrane protein